MQNYAKKKINDLKINYNINLMKFLIYSYIYIYSLD